MTATGSVHDHNLTSVNLLSGSPRDTTHVLLQCLYLELFVSIQRKDKEHSIREHRPKISTFKSSHVYLGTLSALLATTLHTYLHRPLGYSAI